MLKLHIVHDLSDVVERLKVADLRRRLQPLTPDCVRRAAQDKSTAKYGYPCWVRADYVHHVGPRCILQAASRLVAAHNPELLMRRRRAAQSESVADPRHGP